LPLDFNDFAVAAREAAAAYEDRKLWAFIRHGRLTEEEAGQFWRRIADLVDEFDRLPRDGDSMYGFAAGIYPVVPWCRSVQLGDVGDIAQRWSCSRCSVPAARSGPSTGSRVWSSLGAQTDSG
jgi:hypothetical protein